jgi:two-component system cell cycle sensor histidine kinase/response regulator CckA
LISSAEGMLRRLLGEDIELVIDPGGRIPLVSVDPVQIEQVIMNLAINARDAMPDGGKLVIKTGKTLGEDMEPDLSGETVTGTYVTVTVSDTGTGMAEEILSHIFEPFYTTKEVGQGTGLGLSMAYGTVRQSGGFILVNSRPGEGSSFRILLPAGGKTAVREERRPLHAGWTSAGQTILVVEDDENVLALLNSLLRNSGFKVLSARQGSEALACLKNHRDRIDLMVTDLILPGINGLELAAQVKSGHPDLEVLYISGYSPESELIRDVQRRKKSYLAKPFDTETFLQRVRELLP